MDDRLNRLEGTMVDHEKRIRDLENDRAETKVYTAQILQMIGEIKGRLDKHSQQQINPIMLELVKLIGTAITILGAIAGYKAIGG